MPFAVHLDIDPSGAAVLDRMIVAIKAAAPDAVTPHDAADTTHISLAVYDDRVHVETLERLCISFAGDIRSQTVTLHGLGVFPGPQSVLFAAPTVSPNILDVHRQFHEAAAELSGSCWNHYRPGAWAPHVTLGMGLSSAALGRAIRVASELWTPLDVRLGKLRVFSFPGASTLVERVLASEFDD